MLKDVETTTKAGERTLYGSKAVHHGREVRIPIKMDVVKNSEVTEKIAHTPGPWYCNKTGEMKYSGFTIREKKTARSICAYASNGKRPLEEQQANANLIAAAPELLEALKAFVSHSMGGTNNNGETWIGWQKGEGDSADKLAFARAAIAKAEGRAQ
jgi:hypothetical protein